MDNQSMLNPGLGGVSNRSGDRKLTVSATVATTVTLLQYCDGKGRSTWHNH